MSRKLNYKHLLCVGGMWRILRDEEMLEILQWAVELPRSFRLQFVSVCFRKILRQAIKNVLQTRLLPGPCRLGALAGLGRVVDKADTQLLPLVLSCLDDADPAVRQRAIHTAGLVAAKGDKDTVAKIIGHLGDPDSAVVQASRCVLSELCLPCGAAATEAIALLLEHPDPQIRIAALDVLGNVGVPSEVMYIISSKRLQSDPEWVVRALSLNLLGHIGTTDCQRAIPMIVNGLRDIHHLVRGAAVTALGSIAKGDAAAIAHVGMCLDDEDTARRDAAMEAFMAIAVPGDLRVVAAASVHLGHQDACIRSCALKLLGHFMPPDDENCLDLLVARLKDQDAAVRATAVKALCDSVLTVDRSLVNTAAENIRVRKPLGTGAAVLQGKVNQLLEHDRPEVRSAALEVYAEVALGTNMQIAATLEHGLADVSQLVRRSAVRALSRLARAGHDVNGEAHALILGRTDDSHELVRAEAIQLCTLTVQRGDHATIRKLQMCLHDPVCRVRRCAVDALRSTMLGVDSEVSIALAALLADPMQEVRGAAAEVLAHLVGPDDVQGVQAIAAHLDCSHDGGRTAAMQLLQSLIERGSSAAAAAVVKHLKQASSIVQTDPVFRAFAEHYCQIEKDDLAPSALVHGAPCSFHRDPSCWWACIVSGMQMARRLRFFHVWGQAEDAKKISKLLQELQDPDALVRARAVKAFTKLSERGDAKSVMPLVTSLRDRSAQVRRCAAISLREVALPGDLQAISALALLLEDGRQDVRSSALDSLRVLVKPCDAAGVKAVAAQLDKGEVFGRQAAWDLLAGMAAQGCNFASDALVESKAKARSIAKSRSAFGAFSKQRQIGMPHVSNNTGLELIA